MSFQQVIVPLMGGEQQRQAAANMTIGEFNQLLSPLPPDLVPLQQPPPTFQMRRGDIVFESHDPSLLGARIVGDPMRTHEGSRHASDPRGAAFPFGRNLTFEEAARMASSGSGIIRDSAPPDDTDYFRLLQEEMRSQVAHRTPVFQDYQNAYQFKPAPLPPPPKKYDDPRWEPNNFEDLVDEPPPLVGEAQQQSTQSGDARVSAMEELKQEFQTRDIFAVTGSCNYMTNLSLFARAGPTPVQMKELDKRIELVLVQLIEEDPELKKRFVECNRVIMNAHENPNDTEAQCALLRFAHREKIPVPLKTMMWMKPHTDQELKKCPELELATGCWPQMDDGHRALWLDMMGRMELTEPMRKFMFDVRFEELERGNRFVIEQYLIRVVKGQIYTKESTTTIFEYAAVACCMGSRLAFRWVVDYMKVNCKSMSYHNRHRFWDLFERCAAGMLGSPIKEELKTDKHFWNLIIDITGIEQVYTYCNGGCTDMLNFLTLRLFPLCPAKAFELILGFCIHRQLAIKDYIPGYYSQLLRLCETDDAFLVECLLPLLPDHRAVYHECMQKFMIRNHERFKNKTEEAAPVVVDSKEKEEQPPTVEPIRSIDMMD